MSQLDEFVQERSPTWIALRREFHKHAELGFTEYRTAATLAHHLTALGFRVRVGDEVMAVEHMRGLPPGNLIDERKALARAEVDPDRVWLERMAGGQTGVVAELTRGNGPVIALRFDIDALPIQEASDAAHAPAAHGFACDHGAMHACGHDGHAAIGLGVAQWLSHPHSDWRGTVRLIFQPAEEGGRGARPMAEAGVVDDVDYFFAAHLGTGLGSGKIGAAAVDMLYSTKLDARFTGQAAHAGGNPHQGRNALLAGASATLNLHAIARHGDGRSRINVGKMVAGEARNIIAPHCLLELEVRGETEEVSEYMLRRARAVISSAADMHEVTAEVEVVGQTIGGPYDEEARALVEASASDTPGVDDVLATWRMTGGEDAPFFMRRVQARGGKACYFIIGSDLAAYHHAQNFDFDEASLAVGVGVYARVVERASKQN